MDRLYTWRGHIDTCTPKSGANSHHPPYALPVQANVTHNYGNICLHRHLQVMFH